MIKRHLQESLRNSAVQDEEPGSVSSSSSESESELEISSSNTTDAKKRVLIVPSRGLGFRFRHFMLDLHALMPHSKKESKLDTKNKLILINELCELDNCNYAMFLEGRKNSDLYLWLSDVANDGPCARFYVQNVHTAGELNLKGNCMRKGRAIVSFSPEFSSTATTTARPELVTVKGLLEGAFSVEEGHPKCNSYYDRVISFTYADDRIWYRNFEINVDSVSGELSLLEIGPRFCMQLIKIHERSFAGPIIFHNDKYQSPNEMRSAIKKDAALKYSKKVSAVKMHEKNMESLAMSEDELDTMFH